MAYLDSSKKLKLNKIFIAVPTLLLLSQTFELWQKESIKMTDITGHINEYYNKIKKEPLDLLIEYFDSINKIMKSNDFKNDIKYYNELENQLMKIIKCNIHQNIKNTISKKY